MWPGVFFWGGKRGEAAASLAGVCAVELRTFGLAKCIEEMFANVPKHAQAKRMALR